MGVASAELRSVHGVEGREVVARFRSAESCVINDHSPFLLEDHRVEPHGSPGSSTNADFFMGQVRVDDLEPRADGAAC